jgi:hypothetical protein
MVHVRFTARSCVGAYARRKSPATPGRGELTKHDVPNRLYTVAGGGHGGFTREQNEKSFAALREFLGERGLLPARR